MTRKILTICLSLVLGLLLSASAYAQTSTPPNPSGTATPIGGIGDVVRQVGAGTPLSNLDKGHSSQAYESGASQITSIIYYLLDFFKYILGSIAVIMIIVSGMKLILAGRQVTEAMSREKETIRFAFVGLILIILADQIIKVFFGAEGEIYRTGTDLQLAAQAGSGLALGATNLLRVFIPSIAVLFMIIAGFRLLSSGGDTDKLNKAKKQITWAVLGLILAGLAEVIIYTVVYPNLGTSIPDPQAFTKLVITMTNFISGFISTLSVIMIIYAGYLYVVSLGGQGLDKAKTILKGAIIGLLIAMAAFALVNTFFHVVPITNTAPLVNDNPTSST